MSLRFMGDWNPWVGLLLALLLGGAAWWLYRRETGSRRGVLRWLLPAARVAVVLLAVLMLTQPVLHHRKVVGERGRVLLFLDASKSMALTDEAMDVSRKLLAARRLGWLTPEALDIHLAEAADALAQARRTAGAGPEDPADWRRAAAAFAADVEEAHGFLSKVRADTGGSALERRGVILREVWTAVPGGSIVDLTRHPKYPQSPDGRSTLDLFEAPANWGDNYGTRLRGYLHPPSTGNYTFWVAGDDQVELWISPDGDPTRRQVAARVTGFSGARQWDAAPEQKSAPVRLTAGQKVYVEVLHKEGGGEDSVAVGWQLPEGKMERPIPGSRLSAPTGSGESPTKALDGMVARFREELLAPAQALGADRGGDAAKGAAKLQSLIAACAKWERELRDAFANYASRLASSDDKAVAAAVKKYDATPRLKRVEALLTGGVRTLLDELAEKHHVELLSLTPSGARPLWSSGGAGGSEGTAAPRMLAVEPTGPTTNLSDGLKARLGDKSEERVAAILFSDGQHNEGGSPLGTAKMLGNRRIPVHTVSVGAPNLPEDLALLGVKAPSQVFFKDRVRGEVQIKDDMPPGRPFTVRILCNGQPVWEKPLTTEQTHLRSVPFDFPVQELAEKLAAGGGNAVQVLNQPLSFSVSLTAVEGEKEASNNGGEFALHAILQRRKVLILDGRPRWETRYVRNLFDRDEQWEVNALVADRGNEGWSRGRQAGQFPADRETLFGYDLIVFGEVPRQFLKMEELEWIRDFVARRGGGLVVIDGRRGHVAGFAETPLGATFPVDWKAEPARVSALKPTERGAKMAMLQLTTAAERNAEVWASLQPPHWMAPARALPGSEVLLEAVAGERRLPALVFRRFGAGKVLYAGFDESWRWRYEVADQYHTRYWNQVVREIMEPPFAVRDARTSLNVGKLVYGPDEAVDVRARLRDVEGRPLAQGGAEALVYREGKRVATVKLAQDDNGAGLFEGRVTGLEAGTYEIRVRGEGQPEPEGRLRTEFKVSSREAGELAILNANEDLLRQIAVQSGGEAFREEDVRTLAELLQPLSKERVFESDTQIWQSWIWFLPMLILLTLEWVLRKLAGML
jgi:hypothetical protein